MRDRDTDQPIRPATLLIIWGAVGALVIAIIAFGGWQWAGSGREDLAQWIMAGAAVVTLLAATGAAVFAAGAYRVELQREARFIDAELRSQAERIAAWGVFDTAWENPAASNRGALETHMEFRNASDLPVYSLKTRVSIRFSADGGIQEFSHESTRAILPPGTDSNQIPVVDLFLSDAFVELNPVTKATLLAEANCTVDVTLQFKDAGGRAWVRTPDGRLFDVEVDET